MNPTTTLGLKLVERAAKYACDWATIGALHVAAVCGELPPMEDPERFIDDMMRATWEAMRHAEADRVPTPPAS